MLEYENRSCNVVSYSHSFVHTLLFALMQGMPLKIEQLRTNKGMP